LKKLLALLVSLSTVIGPCYTASAATNNAIEETNLGGVRVEGTITYANAPDQPIPLAKNPIFLYINGSIYSADVIIENDRTLVPLRFISERLGAQVAWDDATRKVTITDGDNTIELIIGDSNPKLNGKTIPIDAAPKIYNDYTYVPLRFIAEALGCKVDWFDGTAAYNGAGPEPDVPHYPIGDRQVMISRYSADLVPLKPQEALDILKQQLIIAYGRRFGVAFSPLDTMPNSTDEQETYRYYIPHISVVYENDRFYAIHFVWTFFVDKYTGTVFLFYGGSPATFYLFNPYTPGGMIGFVG